MLFTFTPAVRRNTHILVALAGASGSGKTYSALELATGLSRGGKIAVIDTEAGRALHYADKFQFDHCDLGPPFNPTRYREAIEAAAAAGYAVIVVDSMSHEHAGEGGLLEMAEAELLKPNMKSPANWAAPKAAHKRMMNRLLQLRSHLIFCLRAEEKIKLERVMDERTGREKTAVVPMGWAPICEKTFMFEMVVSFVLSPEHPGVPVEGSGKIQDQHRVAFPVGQRVTRAAGETLAEWANGGVDLPPAPQKEAPVAPMALFQSGQDAAKCGMEALREWWVNLTPRERGELGAHGRSSGPHMEKWKEIAAKVDKQAEPVVSPAGQRPEAEVPVSPTDAPEEPPRGDNFGLPDNRTKGQIFAGNVWAQVDVCKTTAELEKVMEMWQPQINDPRGVLTHAEYVALQARIDARKTDLVGNY